MKYNTEEEFIIDLINNKGKIFKDDYGRRWSYRNGQFYFNDLNENKDSIGLKCTHLFDTNITIEGK